MRIAALRGQPAKAPGIALRAQPGLRRLLAVIGTAVLLLGAGQAAAGVGCSSPTFHLYDTDDTADHLVLVPAFPSDAATEFVDSPALSRGGGNPYQLIGTWEDGYVGGGTTGCSLAALSPLHVWLGLRNGDDQGTNFDLRADVYFESFAPGGPTTLVASVEQLCIKGLTRNPALAQEIVQALPLQHTVAGDGEFFISLYARIGTGTSKSPCGGHNSATGLRVYYGSTTRDSRFDTEYEGI